MSITPVRRTAHAVRSDAAATRRTPTGRAWVDGAWRLAEALTSPLVPADYLDLLDPLRSGAELRGRVVAVDHETADAVTVTIRPGRGWAGHVAGQYIRIGVDVDGVRHWRAYSLTCPAAPTADVIAITVKAIPDGVVSGHIVRALRPGTLVALDQATGDFVLPDPLPPRILFLTAGSGITPVAGMLRTLREEGRLGEVDVVVHHAAPRADEMIFAGLLRELDGAGLIRLIARHDDEDGMLAMTDLETVVPDWRERQAWVCGPTGMLDAAEEHWSTAGLADALHTERFRPPLVDAGEGGEITFVDSDVTVEADGGTTILDAGEDAGVILPSGCRMGICMGCVVTLRQGAVRDLRTGETTVAEPGDGTSIQTCISAVAGSCDLEA